MEEIKIKGELIMELKSKQDWVNRVPRHLPPKTRNNEVFLWVDVNGNVFETGLDFMVAEEKATYPCRVYRTQTVAQAHI